MGFNYNLNFLANYEILSQQTKRNNCRTKATIVLAVERYLQNIENACTAIKTYERCGQNFWSGRWKTNRKRECVKLSSEFIYSSYKLISENKTTSVLRKVKVQMGMENTLWKSKQEK